MSEWLNELKAGDRVVVSTGYGYRREHLSSVTKVTATQIVCGTSRFKRSNGYVVGGDTWNRACLVQPTTDVLERVEERQLREKIEAIAKDKATTLATLRAMYATTKEPTA